MNGLGGGKNRSALIFGCALISLVLICGLALASGGGEQGGAHDNEKLLDLLARCINFALLVIILVVVVKKTGITGFFGARIQEIRKRFDDLKAEKDAVEGRYQEIEKRLREFEVKKTEIIDQFRAEGAAEKDRIIAQAKERVSQILAQADVTIEREILAARDRLRQEVVDVAAQKAREIIEKEIKDSDQDHLVNEFIERVEKLH
ncbi:MAG: ATP synthase F0 subunit B [Thermodesulfobacteriota bacterium]|nr:ATP synthase F0 subunit B [Thermodesulfobacteriota bacterium]